VSLKAVYYSAVSYCLITDILIWDCGRPCEQINGVSKEDLVKVYDYEFDTFGLIAYNKFDKELVISFRGTNAIDIPNWSMNFKSEKVPYEDVEGAQIHAGWYIGWKNLRDDTLAKVADMIWKYQPKKILLTGHSLGGALATLAAIEIKLHSGFMGDIQLYTYG
jgi:predicted lipase